jgi:hypothetical protein
VRTVFPRTTAQILRGDVLLEVMRQFEQARHVSKLVIVSPWITPWKQSPSFAWWLEEMRARRLRTTVITRSPQEESHFLALQALARIERVEVLCNDSIHAKIIACPAPFPWGFGVVGSANVTKNSLSLIEIALLILTREGGDHLVKELAEVGDAYLRAHLDSIPFQERDYRGF